MRHRLRITLDIAGLVCNLVAAGFAAAAVYVNQEALTALSTTAWGSTDQFKTALLWQSRDMILAAMLLAFGTALQVAADRQIYGEGDEARYFYKVISGLVRTCRFLSDGRRQIDTFYRAGDVFGFEAGADHVMAAEAVMKPRRESGATLTSPTTSGVRILLIGTVPAFPGRNI